MADCDFEANSCGWFEASGGDHFDWVWSSQSDLPAELEQQAPTRDHTHGTAQGKTLVMLYTTIDCWLRAGDLCLKITAW